CSPGRRHAPPSSSRPLAARSPDSVPSMRGGSATRTSRRWSRRSSARARPFANCGPSTRCSPASSGPRSSSTPSSGRSACATCSRFPPSTRSCGSRSSRPSTRRPARRWRPS
ncbi:MAG: hypothetical protein AVDCRST_MAG53-747, partial [uncultured Solirubrobacteraceae bacterium]